MIADFNLKDKIRRAESALRSLKLSPQQMIDKYNDWSDIKNRELDITEITDHEMWLHERSLGIGGSDIGALLGVSQYNTKFTLWQDKAFRLVEFTGNELTKWGSLLEDTIADNCASVHQLRIIKSPEGKSRFGMPWLKSNIDFDVPYSTMMGEVKTSSAEIKQHWGDGIPEGEITSEILNEYEIVNIEDALFPLSYFCQTQYYMDIHNKKHCLLTVLIGGNDSRTYIIKANPLFQHLIRLEATYFFMHNVIGLNKPLLTEFELMEELISCDFSGNVEAPEDMIESIGELTSIKNRIKELTKEKDAIEKAIKFHIGDKENLVTEDQTPLAVWGGYEKTTIDKEMLEDLHPDIFKEVSKTAKVRTLRIKK